MHDIILEASFSTLPSISTGLSPSNLSSKFFLTNALMAENYSYSVILFKIAIFTTGTVE